MRDGTPPPDDQALSAGEARALKEQQRDLLVVAKGGGAALGGGLIVKGVTYFYSIVLVWGLGGENFGLYTLALAIVNFVGVIAEMGLSLGIVRFGAIDEARGQSTVHKVTVSALLICAPVALVFFVLLQAGAGLIAEGAFHKPEMTVLLRLLAWSVLLMPAQSLLTAAIKARKLVQYTAVVGAAQSVSALVLAILFMLLKLGLNAVVFSYVLSHVLGLGLAIIFYLRVVPRHGNAKLFPMKEMIKFSLPLTFMKWIQFANDRTEVIFLGFLPSAVYVGIYRIAWSLAGLETIIRLSLEEILAPFSSDLSHRKENGQLAALYKTTAKWSFTGALLLASVYVLFGATIMRLFDPGFAIGAGVLAALALAQLFNEATGACGTILIMSGRSDLSLLNTVVLFASSVALDWLLIPTYGLAGAAAAGAATVILINILRVIEVWVILHMHPFTVTFLKPIAASLVAAALVVGARLIPHFSTTLIDLVYGMVFACVYAALILLLKLDPADLVILQAVSRRMAGFTASHKGTA